MDFELFLIQDWREVGDIITTHFLGILNQSDDMTKPLGCVLHIRYYGRIKFYNG